MRDSGGRPGFPFGDLNLLIYDTTVNQKSLVGITVAGQRRICTGFAITTHTIRGSGYLSY
jgi:hypothetical protein